MLKAYFSIDDAILLLSDSKVCIPDTVEKGIFTSLFSYFVDNEDENSLKVLDYIENQSPSLIYDLIGFAADVCGNYENSLVPLKYVKDSEVYIRLCELVLQMNDEDLLMKLLNSFTCESENKALQCWNTLLSYRLRDFLMYEQEEYKIINHQARNILMINKALASLLDE